MGCQKLVSAVEGLGLAELLVGNGLPKEVQSLRARGEVNVVSSEQLVAAHKRNAAASHQLGSNLTDKVDASVLTP